jgi:alcohol dehydrogenase
MNGYLPGDIRSLTTFNNFIKKNERKETVHMLAAVLKGIHQVGLEEVPKPVLQKDTDVILKVTATAICTSEVHYAEGYLPPCPPFIIGHEFVGIIEEVGGAVKLFKPGDRVDVASYPYCGICEHCRKGITGLCPNGALLGSGENFGNLPGGLAEYVRVPLADSSLVKIPDEVSDEEAVFVGDMLATGYFGISNCSLKPGDTVAIIGAGPVGLCAVQAATLYSPSKIILIDLVPYRLEIGLKMGATHIVNAAEQDPVERVMELTDGKGVDAAVEAVGLPTTVNTAGQVVGLGGILSIVGFPPGGNFDFPLQSLLMKNITVKMGLTPQHNMRILMELVAEKKLDVTPLITHRMPFKEFDKAFKMFAEKQGNCIKVILKP